MGQKSRGTGCIDYRVPKRELLDKIAQALRVDRQNFYTIQPGCAEDFMRTFFWLDEDSPGSIRLFQLVRNPGKTGASDDTAVRYNDTDDWPAQPPVGIYFNYGLVDEFMREWLLRQQELHAGEIRPGTNTLNGNSTGHVPVTTAKGLTTMFPGKKKNRTSEAALLNLSFSRAACLPFAIILLCGRVETNSINPVSQGKVTGQKPCIHAGLSRFNGHSHSTKTNAFCLGIILCNVSRSFDYLIYPYYPAYTS